jgi:preflagellin peptidase FlaK
MGLSLAPQFLLQLVAFMSTLGALLIASYTDLKARIVPNKLNALLLLAGVTIHMLASVIMKSVLPILLSLSAMAIAFGFSLILYRAGFWAGGDVKLLTAIAAANPVNYAVIAKLLSIEYAYVELPIFSITMFIGSVFAMLPVGLALMVARIMKRKELIHKIKPFSKENTIKLGQALAFALFIASLVSLLAGMEQRFGLAGLIGVELTIILGYSLLPLKIKAATAVVVAGMSVLAGKLTLLTANLYVWTILFVSILILITLVKLSREVFKEKVRITELEEGMIPAETIYLENGKPKRGKGFNMRMIFYYIKRGDTAGLKKYLKEKNVVVSSRRACGLTPEEIKILRKYVKQGMLKDELEVKVSTPMVPAMLVAYIALNVIGDSIWLLKV